MHIGLRVVERDCEPVLGRRIKSFGECLSEKKFSTRIVGVPVAPQECVQAAQHGGKGRGPQDPKELRALGVMLCKLFDSCVYDCPRCPLCQAAFALEFRHVL